MRFFRRCYQLLGTSGFEKDRTVNSKKNFKNPHLFEVWMVELAKLTEAMFQILLSKKAVFQTKTEKLLQDPEFFNAISYYTTKTEHVAIRYQKIQNLIQEFLND